MSGTGGKVIRRRALSALAGSALAGSLLLGGTAAPGQATVGSGDRVQTGPVTVAASRRGPDREQPGPAVPAINPPGTTERASVATDGTEGDYQSGGASADLPSPNPDQAISADGQWVAFVSSADNLTKASGSSTTNAPVFLRNRATGTTTAIPWVNGDLFPFGAWVGEVSISAHGEVVAFTVYAGTTTFQSDTLAPAGSSFVSFVAVWRRSDGKTIYLTQGQTAVSGRQPSVSADSRYVAYTAVPVPSPTPTPTPTPAPTAVPTPSDTTPPTLSWNQPPPTNPCPTGALSFLVNASDASGVKAVTLYYWPPGGTGWLPQAMAPSPGTIIWSTNLSYPTSGTGSWAGQTFYYYVGATDIYGNYAKLPASGYNTATLSSGCIYLGPPTAIYASARIGPLPGPPTFAAPVPPTQVVVFDLSTGSQTVISRDSSGTPGASSSAKPSISADGRYVAFASDAGLVPADGNSRTDIYRYDAVAKAVARITVAAGGDDPDGASESPSISGDGSAIAFTSTATNLTRDGGLSGNVGQVFVWRSSRISLVSVAPAGAGSAPSSSPSISQDGRIVAFDSLTTDLVPNDTNGTADVFLRNVAKGVTIRASIDNGGQQGMGASQRPSVSGDGRAVAFDSAADALVPSDGNKAIDVFVRDLPPALQVGPASLDFGTIGLGTTSPAQSVVATSFGWTPVQMRTNAIGGTNPDDFGMSDRCSGGTLDLGDSCTIDVDFVPKDKGPRTGTLEIADSAADSPQQVALFGGAGLLRLDLNPPLGSPGFVTTATGSGFPPGAVVELHWDRGLTAGYTVFVGKDGTFSVQVLIFHNDVIGLRTLIASPPAVGSPAFPPVSADFLVVQAPMQPPGTGAIRYLAPGLELIVIRR